MEKEISFEELFEQSMKSIEIGKSITGEILSITKKGEIYVDIGYKSDGIIPNSEYSYIEGENPEDEFKVGDKITAEVLKLNDGTGNVLLSYKRLKSKNVTNEFEEKIKNNEIFEEKIEKVTEKGFITNYKGIRIFIPLSLSGITRQENIEDYKGKVVKFRITEYEKEKRKVVGSVKTVLDEVKAKQEEEFWKNAEIGKEYKGTVTSISSYGAFITIGVVQGLLHESEMTWAKNANPSEILKMNQEVEVKVKDIDKENKRLKLSLKDKGPNPWENIEEKYKLNDIVEGKIVKFTIFGAFAQIEPGIEGLIHLSQITHLRINKPEDVLQIGQIIKAEIIKLDIENQKIELSMRTLESKLEENKKEETDENKRKS